MMQTLKFSIQVTHHPTREAKHLTLLTRELQDKVPITIIPLTILAM